MALLELTRSAHEELEYLERQIVKEFRDNEPKNSTDRLLQDHNIRAMIDEITTTTLRLVEIYEDKDGTRKEEISALGGLSRTTPHGCVFSEFYETLKHLRKTKHNDDSLLGTKPPTKKIKRVEFSGEEAHGKFLDLHELYNCYNHSKFEEPIEYSTFLQVFQHLPERLPRKHRVTEKYRDYLEKLLTYLKSFLRRTQPLLDLDRLFLKVRAEFENRGEDLPSYHDAIDLDNYSTVEDLMEVDPKRLKAALAALGLKSGGPLQQRAERLFLTKNTPLENLDLNHFVLKKPSKVDAETTILRDVALMEAKIKKLCNLLEETIVRTQENVERKQALTYEEMEIEREAEEDSGETSDGDEEEKKIHNPLELPMGLDKKPIPYWLYKLHGLGQEFKCEICGDYSYRGRRDFEKHFKESRHQFGMARLGIPNTKNFHEITCIEEARELWNRIQERQGGNKWRPELDEEYEDEEGNIYNKKIYSDMKRQGLI